MRTFAAEDVSKYQEQVTGWVDYLSAGNATAAEPLRIVGAGDTLAARQTSRRLRRRASRAGGAAPTAGTPPPQPQPVEAAAATPPPPEVAAGVQGWAVPTISSDASSSVGVLALEPGDRYLRTGPDGVEVDVNANGLVLVRAVKAKTGSAPRAASTANGAATPSASMELGASTQFGAGSLEAALAHEARMDKDEEAKRAMLAKDVVAEHKEKKELEADRGEGGSGDASEKPDGDGGVDAPAAGSGVSGKSSADSTAQVKADGHEKATAPASSAKGQEERPHNADEKSPDAEKASQQAAEKAIPSAADLPPVPALAEPLTFALHGASSAVSLMAVHGNASWRVCGPFPAAFGNVYCEWNKNHAAAQHVYGALYSPAVRRLVQTVHKTIYTKRKVFSHGGLVTADALFQLMGYGLRHNRRRMFTYVVIDLADVAPHVLPHTGLFTGWDPKAEGYAERGV